MLKRLKFALIVTSIAYIALIIFGFAPAINSMLSLRSALNVILSITVAFDFGLEVIALSRKVGAFKARQGNEHY